MDTFTKKGKQTRKDQAKLRQAFQMRKALAKGKTFVSPLERKSHKRAIDQGIRSDRRDKHFPLTRFPRSIPLSPTVDWDSVSYCDYDDDDLDFDF